MASAGFDIAKAGWLYRQSSVLHRWKKNWFVLDRLGDLRYFESPDTPRAEERIVVRAVVVQIKSGPECRKADLPEGINHSKACYLELVMKDRESMLLCAESFDDMRAWQIALEESRTLPVPVQPPSITTSTTTYVCPPGYYMYGSPYVGTGYPGQIISPPPAQVLHTSGGTTIINAPPGQQIVYVDDGPYRYRRGYTSGIYPVPLFFW
ncbi:Pleckstrin y domain-containing B member 2 [Bulinus truncatus]|nr:Pleckstrin y domain-containing B member 2 [Bulinus truncatus]